MSFDEKKIHFSLLKKAKCSDGKLEIISILNTIFNSLREDFA